VSYQVAAVELTRVSKVQQGGEWIFRDFNLHVPSGQVLAIVGRSGVGKSTLLQAISLLTPIEGGQITLFGESVTTRDVGRPPLDYLFQSAALLPWRTAEDNLILTARCRGKTVPDARSLARIVLEAVGLKGRGGDWPDRLSGGQRQLLAMANTMMIDSRLLLLDEPTSSLDFQTKVVLEARLKPMLRYTTDGSVRTSILVTHDINQALSLADRVLVFTREPTSVVTIALDTEVPLKRGGELCDITQKDLFRKIWAATRTDCTSEDLA
jgi:NitT/TauT family transport system ATP-binding protein